MGEGYYNGYNYSDESELNLYKETENLVVQRDIRTNQNKSTYNNIINTGDIQAYNMIIVYYKKEGEIYERKYTMTADFKNAVDSLNTNKSKRATIMYCIGHAKKIQLIVDIFFAKSSTKQGGKKAVLKYTVKQLQAIASKNNIKITKKVDGKTVRLNKQGLMTRLKRYKLI
jgi:hypothetical protein